MAPAAERITDKVPSNFALVGLIHLALPNACIIHMRCDPIAQNEDAEQPAGAIQREPRCKLRISAPDTFGSRDVWAHSLLGVGAMKPRRWSVRTLPGPRREAIRYNGDVGLPGIDAAQKAIQLDDVVNCTHKSPTPTFSINDGFTITDQITAGSGINLVMAYLVRTTAAAIDPAITQTRGTTAAPSAIATFKP